MKIKLFVVDLSVKQTSPAGSCILSELIGLSEIFDIHLLATEIDPDLVQKVVFHKIESPSAPLVLRYLVFSKRVNRKLRVVLENTEGPYLIQTTQGQYENCTVSYPHFCHRAYLKKHWKSSSIKGLRRILRKLNHLYHAHAEEKAFKKAKVVVTPSRGLAGELVEMYPSISEKIKVIANPVDTVHYEKPIDFDKTNARKEIGLKTNDIVLSFAALGDFARKGLPELIKSLALLENHKNVKILVVGGKPAEIESYRKMALKMRVENQVVFVGFKKDIRPYLWMSDIFSFPSLYEIFSLVCIQAAAAGVPLMASQMHGVEEYLEPGKNGWLIERTPESIRDILLQVVEGKFDLEKMGSNAKNTAMQYDHARYRKKWMLVYEELIEKDLVINKAY
ncbi:glycosyltransferase family 4 protein [Cytophaga sp. FL35]|uniref:glycosyltransferase family 4 protein n=1 Tax=Cytophaga sp. FL35 TaxID=1904456 RepID=UPI001653E166|nr:glycosyltransferase family 4 protein [Cytophaga sp. FL35]MBC6999406.1 glycosyltransferase family 4 protein [Cytophaga sp. FL35]